MTETVRAMPQAAALAGSAPSHASLSRPSAPVAIAGFARFILDDEDTSGVSIYVRCSAVISVQQSWQDTWKKGGGYDFCYLNVGGPRAIRVLATAEEVLTALGQADAQGPAA